MQIGILFCFLASFSLFATAQTTTNLDQVVVTVNGQNILERDLHQEATAIEFIRSNYSFITSRDSLEGKCPDFTDWSKLFLQIARIQVVQNQIQDAIIKEASKEIVLDETQFQDEFKQLQNSFTGGFSKKATFDKYLECTNQTIDQAKDRFRISLVLKEKKRLLAESITFSQSELEQYLAAYQNRYVFPARIVARVIVLPNRKLASEVLASLKKGADFAALARKYSMMGAAKDGALGAKPNSTEPQPISEREMQGLPKDLVAESFLLVRGGLTRVITSDRKHYIAKVIQYLPPAPQLLKDVQAQVEKDAKAVKIRDLLQAWNNETLRKISIQWADKDFIPAVARVNGQTLLLSEIPTPNELLYFPPDVFYPSYSLSDEVNNAIKRTIQNQAVMNAGFQALGTSADKLDAFLNFQTKDVTVSDAEARTYYQARIKDYRESGRSSTISYIFKRKEWAESFRKEALALGDVPASSKEDLKFESSFYSQEVLKKATRSTKNIDMYATPLYTSLTGQWVVDLIFFPVPPYTKSLESVKDSIVQTLIKQKREGVKKRWIAAQLANAKVENLVNEATKILEQRTVRW